MRVTVATRKKVKLWTAQKGFLVMHLQVKNKFLRSLKAIYTD